MPLKGDLVRMKNVKTIFIELFFIVNEEEKDKSFSEEDNEIIQRKPNN